MATKIRLDFGERDFPWEKQFPWEFKIAPVCPFVVVGASSITFVVYGRRPGERPRSGEGGAKPFRARALQLPGAGPPPVCGGFALAVPRFGEPAPAVALSSRPRREGGIVAKTAVASDMSAWNRPRCDAPGSSTRPRGTVRPASELDQLFTTKFPHRLGRVPLNC